MRKKFAIIGALLLLSYWAVAQRVVVSDTNFLQCLRTKYPTILKGDSLDVQKANKLMDLNCSGQGIRSVEGLQYFTGLVSINLNFNSLQSLPDFSKLTKLENVNVTNNQLQYLPDLSSQKNLKVLVVHKNKIRELPDLSKNALLQRLDVNSNFLDTLPPLGHLKQLVYLNVVANSLRFIPDVENLTALQFLIVWSNKLQSLPPLRNLSNLLQLDASQNQLTKMPDLSACRKLELLYLDRNSLVSLGDFSTLDSLKNVKLYTNQLTFKELLKLTTRANYTTYQITPQNAFKVGGKWEVLENEPLVLSTGIDRGVVGVTYQWFKNGAFLSESPTDSFHINKLAFQDSGKYTCQLKHPTFLGFALVTDTFFVSVKPCLEVEGVTTEVTGIHCMEPGTLTVQGLKPVGVDATYQLKSTTSNTAITSHTGNFVGLKESQYLLSFRRGSNCQRNFSSPILIPFEPCKEAYLTPNNDGDTDNIFFHQVGKATIYDKRGKVVKTLSIPSHWDGTSLTGALVAQGYYTADINNGQETLNISVMY